MDLISIVFRATLIERRLAFDQRSVQNAGPSERPLFDGP
jgi:hypothetical protein